VTRMLCERFTLDTRPVPSAAPSSSSADAHAKGEARAARDARAVLDWGVLHAAHSRRHASVRGVGEACAQAIRTLQDASVDRMRQVAVIERASFAAVTASTSLFVSSDGFG